MKHSYQGAHPVLMNHFYQGVHPVLLIHSCQGAHPVLMKHSYQGSTSRPNDSFSRSCIVLIIITLSAFLSNQSFVNVVCRLLNAAKVETNTSFNHRVY